MTEQTYLDPTGRPYGGAVGRRAGQHDICCVVADLPSGPVACAYEPGHQGPHAWADFALSTAQQQAARQEREEADRRGLREGQGPLTEKERSTLMENNTDMTTGVSYGSEQAENMIAERLRTLRDRGLPAEREQVELELLNRGEIATFESPAPAQQSAHSKANQAAQRRRQPSQLSDPFEVAVKELVDRGMSREDAVARLANAGAVPW